MTYLHPTAHAELGSDLVTELLSSGRASAGEISAPHSLG